MSITGWVIIATIVLLLVYDGIVGLLKQPTESQVLREWGWKFNTLPFCAGFLLGHWFFPRVSVSFTAWGYAIPLLVGLLAWDIAWGHYASNRRAWFRWPGWYALLGIPAGVFLWGQVSGEAPF
jgi:hypothetical protein